MFKIDSILIYREFLSEHLEPENFFDSDCKDDVVQLNYATFILCRKITTGYRHHARRFGLKHKLAWYSIQFYYAYRSTYR
jgi:hypothetical protein